MAFEIDAGERAEYANGIARAGYLCPEAKATVTVYSTGETIIRKIWCGGKDGTDAVNSVYREEREMFGGKVLAINPYAMNPPTTKPPAWIDDHHDREQMASAIRRQHYDCPEAKTADIAAGLDSVLLLKCGPADGSATITNGLSYRMDVRADNYVSRWDEPARSWWSWLWGEG
ncbi:hypothetical protein [Mesorhizobium marinum]|uniref:hypothetical protein n=1 Tax=Mesorhizobium marinum TaxID=3228790 RepID=UPI003464EB42